MTAAHTGTGTDYLCELLSFFLGADIPDFSFKQPGAHHEARVVADCLYLLVLQITQKYFPADSELVSVDTLKKIETATSYIVLWSFLSEKLNGLSGPSQ
jgi:hypothetical protein